MANPQKENGFVPIANEIVDALCRTRLSSAETQILFVVLRKTYGWKKPDDHISLSQFQQLTNLTRRGVCKAVSSLVNRRILGREQKGTSSSTKYWFIKNYDKWTAREQIGTSEQLFPRTREQTGIQLGNKLAPTIDTIQKTLKYTIVHFESLWLKYPNKLGKKAALRHYKASVKTEQDVANISLALENFLSSDVCKRDPQYIPHGSTWFNNWADWVDYKRPETLDSKIKDLLS